jgi:hypothetical protein
MLVMAHHPHQAGLLELGQHVHGAMIAIVALTALGLAWFARGLGLDRLTVLAGLIAYGIALFADIGAATINGFVVTNLVAHGVSDRPILLLAWEANQALARLGVTAAGVAFLLWSAELVRRRGWGRALGVLGILAGAVPMLLLATGLMSMNLKGAVPIYAGQALWVVLAGLYLGSGRLAAERG